MAGNKKEEFDRTQGALATVYSDIIIKYSAKILREKCPNLNLTKISYFQYRLNGNVGGSGTRDEYLRPG